jgi:hypothetical protein
VDCQSRDPVKPFRVEPGLSSDEAPARLGKSRAPCRQVAVYCDATIVLPLVARRLAERRSDIASRKCIVFFTGTDLEMVPV